METQQLAGGANSQKEWYKNWWGAIIALCILPIFAVWFIWAKTKWGKTGKVFATLGVLIITIFALGSNNSSDKNNNQPAPQAENQSQPAQEVKSDSDSQPAPATDTTAQNNTPASPTDQASLEKSLADIVGKASADMSYKNITVDKSDPDRPKDTQMINVGVNVKTFWDKNSLLKDTGKLSSSIFQAVYNVPAMKAYDIIVSYYGDNKDRYGNTSNDVDLTYGIDKPTYEKINWQNFDQTTLCDFLNNEAKITGTLDNTACHVLANIQ